MTDGNRIELVPGGWSLVRKRTPTMGHFVRKDRILNTRWQLHDTNLRRWADRLPTGNRTGKSPETNRAKKKEKVVARKKNTPISAATPKQKRKTVLKVAGRN